MGDTGEVTPAYLGFQAAQAGHRFSTLGKGTFQNLLSGFFPIRRYPPGFSTGGRNFALNHSAWGACGIPDGETIVMIGGFNPTHNYVTR